MYQSTIQLIFMTKLIIFDLDGTLLNTIEDLGTACNHALRKCGFPEREMHEYNTLVGRGIYNLFRKALPPEAATDENVMKMKDFFIPYYDIHKADKTKPYEGICNLLDSISDAGIKMAVASNKYQDGTEKLVRKFFGHLEFSAILGQREGMPIKPDPGIVYEAMKAAGIADKTEVVYVGDSDVDMITGNNAGIRTIGVTWGFRTKEELLSYSPWKIASLPEKISEYINEQ